MLRMASIKLKKEGASYTFSFVLTLRRESMLETILDRMKHIHQTSIKGVGGVFFHEVSPVESCEGRGGGRLGVSSGAGLAMGGAATGMGVMNGATAVLGVGPGVELAFHNS